MGDRRHKFAAHFRLGEVEPLQGSDFGVSKDPGAATGAKLET